MIDEPGTQRITGGDDLTSSAAIHNSSQRPLERPPFWIGGLLAAAMLFGGCSSSGGSKRAALLGVPLPSLSGQSSSEEAAFRKKVEKDPFPSAGVSLARTGQSAGVR